jgi:hypothetical protein
MLAISISIRLDGVKLVKGWANNKSMAKNSLGEGGLREPRAAQAGGAGGHR